MKQVKTADLIGAALDWAVAKCIFSGLSDGELVAFFDLHNPQYSTDWGLAGRIIDRGITKIEDYGECWGVEGPDAPEHFGPTPLIAAMRCFVASKLGDAVDVPEELA